MVSVYDTGVVSVYDITGQHSVLSGVRRTAQRTATVSMYDLESDSDPTNPKLVGPMFSPASCFPRVRHFSESGQCIPVGLNGLLPWCLAKRNTWPSPADFIYNNFRHSLTAAHFAAFGLPTTGLDCRNKKVMEGMGLTKELLDVLFGERADCKCGYKF